MNFKVILPIVPWLLLFPDVAPHVILHEFLQHLVDLHHDPLLRPMAHDATHCRSFEVGVLREVDLGGGGNHGGKRNCYFLLQRLPKSVFN